ncbi:MAG: SDR family NAD(P)-dependent oxidoreductase, partial [Acetobacteraceae bacterium]
MEGAATIPTGSVLITGASSGLGAALAEAYARTGVSLWLGGRDETRLAAVAARCRGKGAHAVTRAVDVTDRDAMKHWIGECDGILPLELVVANAGVSAGTGGFAKDGGIEAPNQAQRIFAVNVTGVFNTVAACVPPMLEFANGGSIVLTSSGAGLKGIRHLG